MNQVVQSCANAEHLGVGVGVAGEVRQRDCVDRRGSKGGGLLALKKSNWKKRTGLRRKESRKRLVQGPYVLRGKSESKAEKVEGKREEAWICD